ncbi:MAG TPA: pitrilysin family protein [Candidatus Saccharimonadales bacterium]|jgi:zinc protease|nr:pitrilysin family protein [Candidatus Saccharimonadales bacterium]
MNSRKIFSSTIVAALALFLAASASAQTFDVKTRMLKNGMKVLVQEDHTIPNVAVYIFYRVGSRNERPGTTGLSHFFEHMMFNGSKKYGPGEFDRTMEAAGGSNNAYTSHDLTVYQDWFPRSALDLIFDLEADRIENLSFDPEKIASERGVVASERRLRVEGSNFGLLNEQLWAAAYTAHTYQWPVVGWMVDIDNWTMEDLRHHFEMGYSPSNATMVVVGDVTPVEIFQLAEKKLEPIAAHAPPAKVTTREPDQLGERRVTVRKFAQLPILMVGYHVPEAAAPEYYALALLETIMLSGQSSRLYKRLVDKDQLALSINGGMDEALDPTLFEFTAQPKAGVDAAAVEKALYEELDRLKTELVSDQELEKARNIALAAFYRQMSTISGRANTLGAYEVFHGDYHKLFTATASYSQVTKEDLRSMAKKYFIEKNRTVATLIPESAEPAK